MSKLLLHTINAGEQVKNEGLNHATLDQVDAPYGY